MEACGFGEDTITYLTRFYEILDEMIQSMERAGRNESISHNFIVQMIPHHRAAIQMSENILKFTNDKQLQRIAENIITSQTKSIEDMSKILDRCSMRTNTGQELALYQRHFEQIARTMFAEMDTAKATNHIGADFLREMIPHHRGAVRMSENALNYCICPELIPILEAIIISQSRGIRQMQQLLQRRRN